MTSAYLANQVISKFSQGFARIFVKRCHFDECFKFSQKTPNLSSTQSGQRTPARLSNWKNEKLTGFNWVRAGFNSTSADEFVQFRKNRKLWNTRRSWLNYYKMAWFILQNDVTANEFKNIWEPERNHWIIKPNLEEEPNFAYFPAKTESNVPVLIESATKLDPDFKQFHKFKLNKRNFSPWTPTSRAEKIAPFDRNHEVNSNSNEIKRFLLFSHFIF